MKSNLIRLKPAAGFAQILHVGLLIVLPALVFVLVRLNLTSIAAVLIILSKWRMFAVRPRHWLANIRANGVDLIVGLSFLIFMNHTDSQTTQLIWAVLYGSWLVLLKPQANPVAVSLQAVIGQVVGLSALFLTWGNRPLYVLVIAAWVVCYSAARHFLTSFDEPYTRFIAYVWAYFAAALTWVLGHWLLFYGVIAQPTLLLSVIGFGLASLYFLEKTDRLSILLRRQIVFILLAVVVIILVFSSWGNKTI